MSGHSKWASIKHKKANVDAKRGKIFTKLGREITVAAKTGGGDPDTNPRLRLAITTAKSSNMPADNIERALKKGMGTLEGLVYEEVFYEGYGPEGAAIYVHCLTDNKNRTSSEVRNIFAKKGGNMAGAGSVSWLFEKKGLIVVDQKGVNEDQLMELAINAGADDLTKSGDKFEILTSTNEFEAVKKALETAKVALESASVQFIPKTLAPISADSARTVLSLIETFEDHDDVQNVYTNSDIPEEVLKELA